MHELAHLLIGHTPARVDVSPDGVLMLNTYNAQQEQEATLAGALLLPRPALMHIRQNRLPVATVLKTFGVSRQMFDYRLRTTGVDAAPTRWPRCLVMADYRARRAEALRPNRFLGEVWVNERG
jgi:Zn-dependent peptidase ImmA (M78 family)